MARYARRAGPDDFEDLGVVSTPKRYVPCEADIADRFDKLSLAIFHLKFRAGWRTHEIAKVMRRSERFVRRRVQLMYDVEDSGQGDDLD